MNDPKHDDCSQVIMVTPFVYIGDTAWRERMGVENLKRIVFLTRGTCNDERQKGRSHPLLRWPRKTNRDLRTFLLASARTALG